MRVAGEVEGGNERWRALKALIYAKSGEPKSGEELKREAKSKPKNKPKELKRAKES